MHELIFLLPAVGWLAWLGFEWLINYPNSRADRKRSREIEAEDALEKNRRELFESWDEEFSNLLVANYIKTYPPQKEINA